MHETLAEELVLEAKLLPPRPRAGWVQRGSLIAEFERAADTRLTLVSAPAGSGKSTLVAQWAAAHGGRVAWLSLDSGDDTATVFWIYVVAALQKLEPTFGDGLLRRLRAPGTALADEVLPQLANALFELAPATLVLDDFQAIGDEEIQVGLLYLIERLPPGFRIVIATQSDPRFGLTGLRAHGELCEIRDLALSIEESAVLLGHALDVELSAEQIRAIHERTEGWAAGLQLAALSARGQPDPVAFLVDDPPDDRYVTDLLWDAVIGRQPPDMRRFLVQTSILERFSASLCAAVTARADADAIIRELERSNVFLVTLDAAGQWHRYHQLFGQALARQRDELAEGEIADLHRRASEWYAEHDRPAEAIEHALHAGDVNFAADELAREWIPLFSEGRAPVIFGWLDHLSADLVAGHPSVCLLASGLAYALGQFDNAEHWLAEFEAQSPPADALIGYPYPPDTAAAVIRGMLALAHGDLPRANSQLRRAYATAEGVGRTVIGQHLGVILFYADDSTSAERLLCEFFTDERTVGHHAHTVHALGYLAAMALDHGDPARARRLGRDALERARAHHLGEYALTSVAEGAFGAALAAAGELEEAEEHLERAVALARRRGPSHEIALAHLQLATGRLHERDRSSARDALSAAQAQPDTATLPRLQRLGDQLTRTLGQWQGGAGAHVAGDELTAAELEVLRMLPLDLTYPQIAQRLFVSVNTLKTHASRIRRKLGVASRSEAVAIARRDRLL